MSSKITRALVSISLATVCLWLLSSGIAQAARPAITSRVVQNPAPVFALSTVTPTVQFVTITNGITMLLGTLPVYRVTTSAESGWPLNFDVLNASTSPITLAAESIEVVSADGQTVPARFALSPTGPHLVGANLTTTFMLSLLDGRLPTGQYTGTLGFSIVYDVSFVTTTTILTDTPPVTASLPVTGIESFLLPVTKQFVLVVSDWVTELEWAQGEFVYVADETHSTGTVRVKARYADATDSAATLAVLAGTGTITTPFKTSDFLLIDSLHELTKDQEAAFTLHFTPTNLPVPGTYNGVIEVSAQNAAPITAPFTLLVPDQPRGSYQLAVAELYQSPQVTTSLPLTSALQFSGIRWLPVSNNNVIPWWPKAVALLLLFVATAMLVGYGLWAWKGFTQRAVQVGRHKFYQQTVMKGVALVVAGIVTVVIGSVALLLGGANLLDLSQALVEDRTLLMWETTGRGPIRDVTVSAGNVVNQTGAEGQITSAEVLTSSTTISAGQTSTVTVNSIRGLSQAGVYQGRILIQSRDLVAGVLEVPVQVTVHDFLFWPALVILLGVLVGGWVKYQNDTAGEKLKQRKSLEEVWNKWNEYAPTDPFSGSCGTVNSLNPLYKRIRERIDAAEQLLNLEPEWGIEDGILTVTSVSNDLTSYQTLGANLTSLKKTLSHLDQSAIQTSFLQTKTNLSRSTVSINGLLDLIENEPKPQPRMLYEINATLIDCQNAIKMVTGTSALVLRERVEQECLALEKELCRGELGEAQQHWQEYFVAELPISLAALREQMNDWHKEDPKRQARLVPANSLLVRVDQCLKNTPVLYGAAWRSLLEAQMAFVAEQTADTATSVDKIVTTAVDALNNLTVPPEERLNVLGVEYSIAWEIPSDVRWRLLALVPPIGPQIIDNSSVPYTWNDIEDGNVTCELDLQFRGFDDGTVIDVVPVGSSLKLPNRVSCKLSELQGDANTSWNYKPKLSCKVEDWKGDPQTYDVVAKTRNRTEKTHRLTIRSPYTIELPLHRLAVGEYFSYQAIYKDSATPVDHCWFEWKFGDTQFSTGQLPNDKLGGWYRILPDYDTSKQAEIQFLVYSTPAPDRTKLVQKSYRVGLVQESAIKALYRDKRRVNFSRRMAALLIALVGGLLAQRAFGLTFGSFEEYLGTFAWGVAVSAGIDPIADGYDNVKKAIQNLVPRPKQAPPNPAGQ